MVNVDLIRNGVSMTACRQPGCTGTIGDGYCDVCGSPAGVDADPFVPAATGASATSPAPTDAHGLTAVRREPGVPTKPKSGGLITACTQQGCTGTIVDGYCDVCGSPAGAAPFVPAAASAASPASADEPGLMAVPASTPAPVDEGIPTLFDLRWSPETTDSIDIEGSREVEATLRRWIEPAAADVEDGDIAEVEPTAADMEEGHTAEVEPAVADVEDGDIAEVEPAVADVEDGHTAEAERAVADVEDGHTAKAEPAVADVDDGDIAEVEPAVADVDDGDIAEVEPAAADMEEGHTAPAGPQHDDKVKMPAVPAVSSGDRQQRPQLPEQQVLGPEPVQTPAEKRRFGPLALAATALAALLIGALLFAATRDRDVTAQSVPTVTATANATVAKPTNAPSNQSTDTGGEESTIQLEDLPESAGPFETVRVQGRYRGGADTFLRVQRWEGGKWLAFPVPTKTDQSGKFTAYIELGQPGRYRLRVLDPGFGVASKPFVLVIKG
jgi:hypothetical protein